MTEKAPSVQELDSLCHLLEIKHIDAGMLRKLYKAYEYQVIENNRLKMAIKVISNTVEDCLAA